MKTFWAKILEADDIFYEGPCEMLIIPSSDGLIGVMAGHANMITALVPGEMTYRLPGEENKTAAVAGGMVKVEAGEVLVLASSIERPEEIDANRARRSADAAREALLQKRSIREYRLAQLDLARAANRIRVKKKSRIG